MKNAPPPRLKLHGPAPALRLPKTTKLVSTPQGRLVYRRPCFLCGKPLETGKLAEHLQRECGR